MREGGGGRPGGVWIVVRPRLASPLLLPDTRRGDNGSLRLDPQ